MKRIEDAGLQLAQWIEAVDWHWIPLSAQLVMAFALLIPERDGAISAFADEYSLNVIALKVFFLVFFLAGAAVLYIWRTSDAFVIGSIPLMLYIVVYVGWTISLNNYLLMALGMTLAALLIKIYLRMLNGKIRHD